MGLTHYKHEKNVCEGFKVTFVTNNSYRDYIKQVKYHRDTYWINLLVKQGLSLQQVELMLLTIKELTFDNEMKTKIYHEGLINE